MLARFFSYVEIKTKITSLFAFAMVLAWLFAQGQAINWPLSLLFFASMFLFDLTTTAINNYVDTKTNGLPLQFPRPVAKALLLGLFCVSTALGLLLAWQTDVVVLLLGGLCFLCGVFYTWGPLPISRLPLGEVFSGLFYGFLLPFILLYINYPAGGLLSLAFAEGTLSLDLRLMPLVAVCLLSVAPFCATANIMLANNICDLERDIAVRRHTLPYYLGTQNALRLFAILCWAPYAAAVLMVLLGMVSWVYLLLLVTAIPVQKNIQTFRRKQEKDSTFLCSIQNYLLLMGADVLLLAVSRFF